MDSVRETDPAEMSPAALAWYGNAAKMRIMERLIADRTPRIVFDYGAGGGAGWAETLRLHPEITLFAYEPDPESARRLRQAVPGAQLFEGDVADVSVQADIAVSFSVFEHVADRRTYLHHAMRCLKPGGTFFLNYDDGHFRHPGNRLDSLRNLAAPILPRIGLTRYYQSTVRKEDADRMIADAGFTVVDDRYENLEGIKNLSKTIEAASRAGFARMWLDLEGRLNREFTRQSAQAFHGDSTNLWLELASRTLELKKSRVP